MPELLGALLLGAVQGITEFAPVSSTAHLVLIPWLFGWQSPLLSSLTFDVALHMGTLAAILWFFARDWVLLARALLASIAERRIGDDPWRRLAWLLALATVPGALAGILLEDMAETVFRSPLLVALALIALGVLLAGAEWRGSKHWGLRGMTPLNAFLVGIGQAVAIIPGVSRSGGTMTTALFLGMEREAAARFSFLLAAPIIAGAGLKKLPEIVTSAGADAGLAPIAAGFLASTVVGYLSIKVLLRYLQRGRLYVFVGYRIAMGALVLAVLLARGSPA